MPRPLPESLRLGAVVLAFAGVVVACTTVPQAPPANPNDTLSGRLALRVEPVANEAPRSVSAAFDLRGDSRAGTLGLSTPLGTMLALARWSPNEVVLTTPKGERAFASLDELTREARGESVPIEAWFDWLRGRPWPGAPSEPAPELRQGFAQLGWRVDLGSFNADGMLNATRTAPPPMVTVRIRLDRS